MDKIASGVFLGVALVTFLASLLLNIFDDARWGFRESPSTKVCYELYYSSGFIVPQVTMSPTDHKFCEKQP